MQWTTGDSSGGTNGLGGNAATAGYDAGDLANFFNIPGSGTSEIINITQTNNVGNPGMWIFNISSNQGSSTVPYVYKYTEIFGIFN